jgi:hypothetical protein
MPNPRNRLKFTGDTRLPDVGDEGAQDEDLLAFEPAQEIESEAQAVAQAVARSGYLEAAREQVRQRPVVALAGAFALGYLFARI